MKSNIEYKYLKEDLSLRHYQAEAKKKIYSAWDNNDYLMFQMPTGTGKTRLFTSIIKDINDVSVINKDPVKILIVAHRKELIDQIDKSLDKYSVSHSIFVGNKQKRDSTPPVLVTSVQTISHPSNEDERRLLRDKVKYIIIDEAHHAVANTYSRLWEFFPNAKILGVTATPYRLNHSGFTDLFQKLILSPSVKQFIQEGWLSPYSYYSLKAKSYINSVIKGINQYDSFGDYKESALEKALDKDNIRAQLVDSYLKFANGKKGIVYSINRTHSEHICKKYTAIGLRVACIDSETPSKERKTLVDDFKDGKLDIIVNVNIFSEGFDCPDIEFIQLARPTTSLSMYLQQVGRGLRTTEGKTNCVILDNVGMYSRFGLPDADRKWNHHFIGEMDAEDNSKQEKTSNNDVMTREKDLSEGSEQMFLIQDINGNIHTEDESINANEMTPREYLDSIGFVCYGYVFWFRDISNTYEAYIQERGQYIISKLLIDQDRRQVKRVRVGRISPDSKLFEDFEWERFKKFSIKHFGGSYTVFCSRIINEKNIGKKQYYDYLGKEITDPSIVEQKYAYFGARPPKMNAHISEHNHPKIV